MYDFNITIITITTTIINKEIKVRRSQDDQPLDALVLLHGADTHFLLTVWLLLPMGCHRLEFFLYLMPN